MKTSRFEQLRTLETEFAAGKVSAETVTKRAAQLCQAFRKDIPSRARAGMLWSAARAAIRRKNK